MGRHIAPEPLAEQGFRSQCFNIIFGYKTTAGRAFDIALVITISLSVIVVLLDSVASINARYGQVFHYLEWFFTLLFTLEYAVRLWVVKKSWQYARSFYGIVDLVSILPTYLSLLFPGMEFLAIIRVIRILRIFQVLQLRSYNQASGILLDTLIRSWRKIFIFLLTMLTIITIFGALLFIIEGPEYGFTSIPMSMYWALVSVSTVGYGDISPITPFGKFVASILILIGYGIIAVPTGIYSAELIQRLTAQNDGRACAECGFSNHHQDAHFCRQCGTKLDNKEVS